MFLLPKDLHEVNRCYVCIAVRDRKINNLQEKAEAAAAAAAEQHTKPLNDLLHLG